MAPLLVVLVACAVEAGRCDYPDAVSVDEVLTAEDDCGAWSVPLDEHLVVAVGVSGEGVACEAALPGSLVLNADPIYTAFGDTGPRWTFDLVAVAEGEGEAVITCDDGAVWSGWVEVTPG